MIKNKKYIILQFLIFILYNIIIKLNKLFFDNILNYDVHFIVLCIKKI